MLGYAIVAARILLRSRLFSAIVEHDGTSETIRTMQVSVGNGRYYGGGMTVQAGATADDGWLDFYSLEVDHWWRLLRLLPSLRKGTQGEWDDVRAFPTTEVTIRTRQPRPVNTDGELTTWTPASFRIRPKSVLVFSPLTGRYLFSRNTACWPKKFQNHQGIDRPIFWPLASSAVAFSTLAPISSHRSTKSRIVQKWMLGVSYQE